MQQKNMVTNRGSQWEAVAGRNAAYDGEFVYGVLSTRIYCRPSCPSRRPARERVVFFDAPQAAERAGFRACRRCRPAHARPPVQGSEWIIQACREIDRRIDEPPSLSLLASRYGVSKFRFLRTFKKVMGVTPRQFAGACRMQRVKGLLRAGEPVARSLYEAGYGSSSRLYENSNAHLGMTPAAYRRGGSGIEIRYAIKRCPGEAAHGLGWALAGATSKGVSVVRLGSSRAELERGLREEFPHATLDASDRQLAAWLGMILNHLDGRSPRLNLPLDVHATAFQHRVWQELMKIPYGTTMTYEEVARRIGKPRAARAVGHACATNPVAVVVPCHRVMRTDGKLGGYRWGLNRKQWLIATERDRAGNGETR